MAVLDSFLKLKNSKPPDNCTIRDTRQLVKIKIPVPVTDRSLQFQVKNIKLQQTLYKVHKVQCKEVKEKGRYRTDWSA